MSYETLGCPPPIQPPVPFCTCGHSLYDHAVQAVADPMKHDLHGGCFVGCGCTRWRRPEATDDATNQRRLPKGLRPTA